MRTRPVCNNEIPVGTHGAQKTCSHSCGLEYRQRNHRNRKADTYTPPAGEAALPVGRSICSKLEEIDILVAHNGVGFDLRFLRTRALEHGLPPLNPAKIVDPVLAARRNLRLPSNSLDSIARHIRATNEKTVLEPGLWARAVMDGDKESMDYIVEHCVKDVEVLAEVTWSLRGYIRVIDALGSYR